MHPKCPRYSLRLAHTKVWFWLNRKRMWKEEAFPIYPISICIVPPLLHSHNLHTTIHRRKHIASQWLILNFLSHFLFHTEMISTQTILRRLSRASAQIRLSSSSNGNTTKDTPPKSSTKKIEINGETVEVCIHRFGQFAYQLLTISFVRMQIPEPPTNCCMSGCANCVWILYADDLAAKFRNGSSVARDIIMKEVEDPNMRSFLEMELRMLNQKTKKWIQ